MDGGALQNSTPEDGMEAFAKCTTRWAIQPRTPSLLEKQHPAKQRRLRYTWMASAAVTTTTQITRDIIDKIGTGVYPDELPLKRHWQRNTAFLSPPYARPFLIFAPWGSERPSTPRAPRSSSRRQRHLPLHENRTYKRHTLLYLSAYSSWPWPFARRHIAADRIEAERRQLLAARFEWPGAIP